MVIGRSAFTTSGPMVILGTKWPSITSTWIQSAPAASTARTSSPSFAKSAARIDGAMTSGRGIGAPSRRSPNTPVRSGNAQRRGCAGQSLGRQRLHDQRQQIDRKLRQRDIEPDQIRHGAGRGRQHQARCCASQPHGRAAARSQPARTKTSTVSAEPERDRRDQRNQPKHHQRVGDGVAGTSPISASAKPNSTMTYSPSSRCSGARPSPGRPVAHRHRDAGRAGQDQHEPQAERERRHVTSPTNSADQGGRRERRRRRASDQQRQETAPLSPISAASDGDENVGGATT